MPEAERTVVAAWRLTPRSISIATIWVSVPFSTMMPRQNASAMPQKRHAHQRIAQGDTRQVGVPEMRHHALAGPGGAHEERDGNAGQHQDDTAHANIGAAPIEMDCQKRGDRRNDGGAQSHARQSTPKAKPRFRSNQRVTTNA